MVGEVEWFSNWSGDLLGTIVKGDSVAAWNYVILKRDRKGETHVRKVMNNFFDLKAARVDLLLSMAEIEKIDQVDRETAIFGLTSVPAELSALNQGRQHGQSSKTSSRPGKTSD